MMQLKCFVNVDVTAVKRDLIASDDAVCNRGRHSLQSRISGTEDGTTRIWQTGLLTHNDSGPIPPSGPIRKVKAGADEAYQKIKDLGITNEGKAEEKEDDGNA
ncbi:hypothetical protein Nepgr_020787 [Nepenthes gracilis]|uniref:Uncharacterized protein n=1 Tax=Nepenthes gracilis TaxID=150966 RepID=A0AAD3XWQ6_NEPGR|nr:hypothetical protein Nepgr_020787 [Nepenthes gracilis]